MARLGGVGTLSVTAAITVAGLVLLQGGGAASGSPYGPSSTGGEYPAPTTEAAPTTEPAGESTTTSTSPPPTTSATTSTTTSTTVVGEPAGPTAVPATMSTRRVTVGLGGFAQLSGTCPTVDGEIVGPVEIWQVGAEVVRIATGISARTWTYDWRAPSTPDPIVLQVWCGDPTGSAVGFPSDQQIVVVFVAHQQASTTTSPPNPASPTTVAAGAGNGATVTIDPLPGTA